MRVVILGILAGVFSTFIMDLSGLIGSKLKLTGRPSPVLIGRWFKIILTQGKFVHKDIRLSQSWKYEQIAGIIIHYSIGSTLGVIFLEVAHFTSLNPANFLDDIIYGIATSIFSWFFMFPSFGFGFLGRHSPSEFPAFRTSALTHVSFGVGLGIWFNALLILHLQFNFMR